MNGPGKKWAGGAILLAAFAAAACSGDGEGSSALDLPTAGTLGGPVMPSPRVQPIYFKGFPYAADIDTFATRLSASTYWPAVTAEYGVGALTAAAGYATNVALPASLTDANLPGLLVAALTEGAATLGPPRTDTVYALFFDPATTLVVMGHTLCAAGQPSAYHDEWTVGGMHVPVAVIPSCPTFPGQTTLTGVNVLTLALSHELVEAATDPLVYTQPAYGAIDRDHILWAVAFNGAEVGDLCENEQPLTVTPADIGYPVQRIWSNAAARAGTTGPCLPVPPGEVYFQAVGDLPEHGAFQDLNGVDHSVPVMSAGVGVAASAHVSFRGGTGAPTDLKAVAFELDDETSLGIEKPTPVMGKLGQAISLPIATSSLTTAGVVPLIIGASSGHGDLHVWVGGVHRH